MTESTLSPRSNQVDARGPRFGAAITAVLLLIDLFLALVQSPADNFTARLFQPATVILIPIFGLFLFGAIAGVQKHPYGQLFAKYIKPKLRKPAELEDAAAPTFAQAVGAFVTGIGLLLHLIGVPLALPIAVAAAFVAAFLNAAFGYCLGCEIYLLLRRAGIVRGAKASQSTSL